MRKSIEVYVRNLIVIILISTVASTMVRAEGASYAEDRALIEDLQARYMLALDSGDIDTYLTTFTEDGILDIGTGEIKGHDAIRNILSGMPDEDEAQEDETAAEAKGPYPATGRHNITNIVIKVDGDKAEGRAYWFHYGNDNPERKAVLNSYGHYVDRMVKVDGQWLFSYRRIYNEQVADWIAPPGNPAW